ncbi:MAG: 5-amino-6-(D-ribitylamino)uracil--L-tyrosine 4-hydroxyphenyl transferase CofH [Candidatus Acidulodesulfobacterium sp.]
MFHLSNKTESDNILQKALSGERLCDRELLILLDEKNEKAVKKIIFTADVLNKKINFNKVSYIVNRNINFTNICGLNCKFCGYKRTKYSKDAFLLDYDKIIDKISEGIESIGIDEICVTGGINPELKTNPDYYFNLIKTVRSNFPSLHIHAFSPQEIFELSNSTGMNYAKVIEKLVDCGLNSMPGTAAEILAEETRRKICQEKINTAVWVEIIKTAHKLGVKTSATILFGHIESSGDLAYHLSIIRQIQNETGGFTEFIALPFISPKTSLGKLVPREAVADDNGLLKFYAVLRLYLDNFKNIQTSWPKIGVPAALKSLECGVNDFGGTLMEENITKSAGGKFGEFLGENEIINLIKQAGKIPVRRDTIYNYVNKNNSIDSEVSV